MLPVLLRAKLIAEVEPGVLERVGREQRASDRASENDHGKTNADSLGQRSAGPSVAAPGGGDKGAEKVATRSTCGSGEPLSFWVPPAGVGAAEPPDFRVMRPARRRVSQQYPCGQTAGDHRLSRILGGCIRP